jgi:hypothetical protein
VLRIDTWAAEGAPTADGPVRWVDKDAFVMPVLPTSLGIDPIVAALLHAVAFLELSGDGTVDPDWAVEALEHIVHYLGRLPAARIAILGEQVARVAATAKAAGWGDEAAKFFDAFMGNFGVTGDDEAANA